MTPLSGYRALDLTDETGYMCGKILADLGMDVIKVEKPGGDDGRRLPPIDRETGQSLYWLAYNAQKKSVTLDLETADGQDLLKKLCASSDFLIESFAPHYLDQLGLSYQALREINIGIILVSITPFGQEGPCSGYKGCDIVAWATSGAMAQCGDPDRPPLRSTVDFAYSQAGMQAATGALCALYSRRTTGEGQAIDVSMQEAMVPFSWHAAPYWHVHGVNRKRCGTSLDFGPPLGTVPYLIPCADGYMLGSPSGPDVQACVRWMDSDRMAEDLVHKPYAQRGASPPIFGQMSSEERLHILQVVRKWAKHHTKQELFEGAIDRRMRWHPVYTPQDIVGDRHLRARQFFVNIPCRERETLLTLPGAFAKLNITPLQIERRSYFPGEHNEDVYIRQLGLTKQAAMALRAARVV